jgi:CO dehydrogenase/acetyl-CoA synthase alpha subunit
MKNNYEDQYENILKKFELLKIEAKEDCKIIKTELETQFINTELLIRWLNKFTQWKSLHRIYDQDKKKKFRELFEYYRTEYELKLSNKDEILLFVESDPNFTAINNLYHISKDVTDYISSVLDILKGRGYEMKEISAWIRFQSGQR